MKRHSSQGFTLIEVLTVIVIILIIAGWVISAFGPAQAKVARARAEAEIKSLSSACESYKADNGDYPREPGITEAATGNDSPIDPQKDGNPSSNNYKASSLALYKLLSGDADCDTRIDDKTGKAWFNFQGSKNMLGGVKDGKGNVNPVQYLQDPFGYSYGYSTAGAKSAEDLRSKTGATGQSTAGTKAAGYNVSFDMWSTGGKVAAGGGGASNDDRAVWIRNW